MLFSVAAAIGLVVQPGAMPARLRLPQPLSVQMYKGMAIKPGEENSFVQTEMRGAAMALHTKQQAPREGKAEAKKVEQSPVQSWQPGRADYLQFLVDSRLVYGTLEELCEETEALAPLRNSGLERAAALDKDIEWFAAEGVPAPAVASQGSGYASFLQGLVDDGKLEAFVCHFYNFYFAHTAGGRMIGKRMAAMLLEDKTLEFYRWQDPKSGEEVDPSDKLLPDLRKQIDGMVESWSREQKDLCIAETADSFKYALPPTDRADLPTLPTRPLL